VLLLEDRNGERAGSCSLLTTASVSTMGCSSTKSPTRAPLTAAIVLAFGSPGYLSGVKTTVLLSDEDGVEAMRKAGEATYRRLVVGPPLLRARVPRYKGSGPLLCPHTLGVSEFRHAPRSGGQSVECLRAVSDVYLTSSDSP
jgi:hypothetical protein